MPMNAPVTEITGIERTPTSYISGKSSRRFFHFSELPSQRKVRAQKMEKSPNAASVLLVSRPMRSMMLTGMGRNDMTGCQPLAKERAVISLVQRWGTRRWHEHESIVYLSDFGTRAGLRRFHRLPA